MRYMPRGAGRRVQEKDYSREIIFSTEDFEEEGHLLQVVTIPPRTKQRLHLHREQTEVFYILEGEGLISISGSEFLAGPGDAFICSPGDTHSLWNQSDEDLKVVVFKISKPAENDTAWLEDQGS
ncbi:MAG: carbohydrate-binding protein [Chloroflexi bacterium B3_Chlor]|nr:MAG: carbohydrate-binding protein [Chloroflexi bacterium B3_Chlor]